MRILDEQDEAKFTQVTYTYYEQLNGYKYLKSLGIGYHFYQGRYFEALRKVLDLDKKTIIHIPNVNSIESIVCKDLLIAEVAIRQGCWSKMPPEQSKKWTA